MLLEIKKKYIEPKDVSHLFKKHQKEILSFVYHLLKNVDDAYDCAQDVFYKFYCDVRNGKIINDNPRAYLFKMARNCCIDASRKNKVATSRFTDSVDNKIIQKSSEDQILASIIIDEIYDYLETNYMEVEITAFKLRYIYKLSFEEIAGILDSSRSSVHRMMDKIVNGIEKNFSDIFA